MLQVKNKRGKNRNSVKRNVNLKCVFCNYIPRVLFSVSLNDSNPSDLLHAEPNLSFNPVTFPAH